MSLFGKTKVETTDIEKRFNLIGRVGQGSMSKVWRAEEKMSGKSIAVKLLDKEKTKQFEQRFKGLNKPSEADVAVSLNHPYIVKTLEVGLTPEHETFLVMDFVEGSGLSLLVDLQSDDMRRYRTRFMIQIGEALAYFHAQNWIHRDICPRNIMVTDDHKIRLIDFGLAVPNTPDFTKPGNRTGTANYMAPELIKRRPTDQRIDVFAYAVTCYEMYTKVHPWDAAETLDAVMQHINQPPIPITDVVPKIDSQIAETIMKGLAIDPDDRWQTVDDMVKEFRAAEVRLVKATRELLAKRKKRAGGTPQERPKAAAKEASKTGSKPSLPAASEPSAAKTKTPAKRTASTKSKKPKPKQPDDEFDPFGEDGPFTDDSAADILSPTAPPPEKKRAESASKPKKKVAPQAKTEGKQEKPKAKPKLKLPEPPPEDTEEDSSADSEQSDDDILALPED